MTTKRELISKVSQHTKLNNAAVELVIEGLIDVAVEEIVNKGEFSIIELFSVTSKDWNKSYSINGNEKVPSRPRLIVKLSRRLRHLWKIRLDDLDGATDVITKDNWREVNKATVKKKTPTQTKSLPNFKKPKLKVSTDESIVNEPVVVKDGFRSSADYNPMLDDDE